MLKTVFRSCYSENSNLAFFILYRYEKRYVWGVMFKCEHKDNAFRSYSSISGNGSFPVGILYGCENCAFYAGTGKGKIVFKGVGRGG
jgi:hypothetical protein